MNQAREGVVLALDVGDTEIKAAVMATDGTVLHTASTGSGAGSSAGSGAGSGAARGPDAVLENMLGLAAELARRYRPVAAGIAVPGVVDEAFGVCVFAANLGWREVPVRQWAEEELDIPVSLGQDVRVGGIAEARLGAGRGSRSFLFVPVGTGIACAVVLDGRALLGGHGAAGELGHLVVRPGGAPCACGGHGCLETVASTSAITRRYRAATGEWATAEEVCGRAAAGDAVAAEVWREAVEALADGLASAVTLFDPRRLIIGGGLARTGQPFFGALRAALAERLSFQTPPEVVPAALGPRAACLGAGLLALDAHHPHRVPLRARR